MIPALGKYRVPPPSGFSAEVLMHFDGANGSTSFIDVGTCGATWAVSTGTPQLSTSAAILGSAALAVPNGGDGVASGGWPTGLSLGGEFTITYHWTCPSASTKALHLTSFQGSGLILIIFFEADAFHWYAGVFGSSDTRYDFTDINGYVAGHTYEIAFSRDSAGNIRFARDGVVSSLVFNDTRSWTQAAPIYIAASTLGPFNPVGVFDEFLMIEHCLFTDNYIPHTAEFVQGSINVFTAVPIPPSLFHFDVDLSDAITSNPLVWTAVGGAAVSATQAKFGAQSLGLTGGYLVGSNAKTVLGIRDFTYDLWVYATAVGGTTFIMDTRTSGGTASGIAIYLTGGLISFSDGGTTISGPTLPLNAWHHVEVGRHAGTVNLFLDGVIVATGTFAQGFSSPQVVLGAAQFSPIGVLPIIGFVDEFHLVVGTCTHTANFTPPTSPYLP